jgi:hypothetical protein
VEEIAISKRRPTGSRAGLLLNHTIPNRYGRTSREEQYL